MSPSDDAPTSRHLLLPLEAPQYEYWRPGWTEAPHVSAQAVDALRYAGRRSASISVPDGYLLPDGDTAPQGPKGLSGSDGTRGTTHTVDADVTRHTSDGPDSGSEDDSATEQGSGIRRTHAWKEGDTPHVAALLGKERAVDRPAPAAPSLRGDPYFDMMADVRAEERNSVGTHLYTVKTTLDRRRHYHHVSQSYHLSINTGEPDTWLYAYGFQKVVEDGEDTYAWSRVEAENGYIHMNRFVVPVPSDGRSWELPGPFPTEHAPSPPLEWTTRHAGGGLAYLRYVPHGILQTELPRWHWADRQQSSTPLRIPCVLAYAANRRLAMQVRAGHIGLAVPSLGNSSTGDPSVSKPSFFDALESSPDLQLDEPRKFLIKLNHPNVEEECARGSAPSLVYFGSAFPCTVQPQFTPRLFVYGRVDVDAESPLKYEHWRLGLSSISLLDTDAPDDILTIDLANCASVQASDDGGSGSPADKASRDYVQVILDTGSTHSILPRRAVQTLSTKWLRNKEELKDGGTVHAYCGPERDLDKCDIVFTFRGLDGAPVEFQCAAKPILQSPWALKTASDVAGETPKYYHSNIRAHVPGEQKQGVSDDEEKCDVPFVFGASFYWAAFVEHCGPVQDKDTSEIHEPYVRLAPQRAPMSDGSIGSAKDFHVPPDPPPKSSEQPAKHEWQAQ